MSFVSQQANASQVIDYMMRQLSFEETELDGEAGFVDVAGGGVESSGLGHDESFGVNDLDLNLNEPVNLNVSQIETQSELPVSEEPDVGRPHEPIVAEVKTQEPIVEEVRTQEPTMEDVVLEDYVSSREDAEQGNGQEDESTPSIDDDDDDEDFLVDEENEIVEADFDVHLCGISMDVPFDNISVTNLVPDDVLEGEDVDVINADGFDSDPGEDNEISNYRRKRRNLMLYKNDSVRIRARCDGEVSEFIMSQGIGPTGPNYRIEARPSGSSGPRKDKQTKNWVVRTLRDTHKCLQSRKIKHCTYKFLFEKIFDQISMSKAFRAKAKAEREIRGDHVLLYSMLRGYVVELQSTNPNTTVKIAVERNTDPSLPTRVFQRIYAKYWQLLDLIQIIEFTHWPMPWLKLKVRVYGAGSYSGIILAIKTVFPSVEHRYCLRHIHKSMKQGWCGQAYKDLLWRSASATSVKEFEKCRAKSDLLLNNICEVFNGKIVEGRDKPVITLLVKWKLTRIPCKHVVAACWDMALNDQATPPPEAWQKERIMKLKRRYFEDYYSDNQYAISIKKDTASSIQTSSISLYLSGKKVNNGGDGTRVLKVINNTPMINWEAKGVTTRGGKTTTQDAENNDTNVRTEEPLAENHDEPVKSNEILTNDQPQKTNEPDAQPSNNIQMPHIPFPRRLRKEKEEAQ
ncbi:hypothetical protein Tco_1175247 [Tanacetum coccineum]